MISAVYVALSLRRIRKFVKTNQTNDEVEVSMLCKHLSALGLYFTGILFFLIALCVNYFKPNDPKAYTMMNLSVIVMNILSVLSQLVVCWIFWNLASKQAVQQNKSNPKTLTTEERKSPEQSRTFSEPIVIYEDVDENSDLQARLWNQFIRRKQVNEHILKRVDKDGNYTGGMVVSAEQILNSMANSTVASVQGDSAKDIYARYKMPNNGHDNDLANSIRNSKVQDITDEGDEI